MQGIRTVAVLALAFWMTAAFAAIDFVGHLPRVSIPAPLLYLLLLAVPLLGGRVAGRGAERPFATAAAAGAACAAITLLLAGKWMVPQEPGADIPSPLLWIPGWIAAGSLLAAAGVPLGLRARPSPLPPIDWTGRMTAATAGTTLLLLTIGGAVTSTGSGMAVPDWPRTFGTNMFLFPLSRMVGGIYYEHAHRLVGALVGLMVVILAWTLVRSDRPRPVKFLATATAVLVLVQGGLGGFRVTEFSLTLAVLHGILGQILLALLAAIATVTATAWNRVGAMPEGPGKRDLRLQKILLAMLLVQLLLGAVLRHRGADSPALILVHVFVALGILVHAILSHAAIRSHDDPLPILPQIGTAVLLLTIAQVMLGVSTWAGPRIQDAPFPPYLVVAIRTGHQMTGALLLAAVVSLRLWSGRLAAPPASS